MSVAVGADERAPVRRGPTRAGDLLGLDPRTKLVLVLAVGVAMSLPEPEPFLPVAALLGGGLLAAECAWRRLGGLLVSVAALTALAYAVPTASTIPAAAVVGYTAAYLLRFVLIAAVASHLVATTSPTHLTAALRAARVPRALVVPLAVTLRFLPVVVTETRAVWDAMRLRGVTRARVLLRHPLRSIEWLTVPAIASTLRVGEDLTASALLRGLGSSRRPTSVRPPRLGVPDLAVLVAVAALAVCGWWAAR